MRRYQEEHRWRRQVFGRKDIGTGILHNKTDGGDGAFGAVRSEETRKKLSEVNKGKNNPNYGKSFSNEHRKKLSEAHKGKVLSEEHRRKNSEAKKGLNNPNYGKKGKNHPTILIMLLITVYFIFDLLWSLLYVPTM